MLVAVAVVSRTAVSVSVELTVAVITVCLFVGYLTSQQHASVSQGRICTDNFTCCHTEIEVADQTFHLTQSQYTDTVVITVTEMTVVVIIVTVLLTAMITVVIITALLATVAAVTPVAITAAEMTEVMVLVEVVTMAVMLEAERQQ